MTRDEAVRMVVNLEQALELVELAQVHVKRAMRRAYMMAVAALLFGLGVGVCLGMLF